MARRGTRNDSTTTENPTTTTEEEATVSTTETENTEATEAIETEAPETPAAEAKPEEKPIDLSGFQSVVAEAVASADESTGEVPEAPQSTVTQAYRQLDGAKAKNAAKAWVNEQMKNHMNEGNLPVAVAYMQLGDKALVAGASGKAAKERVPADPTEAFVQKVATLSLAYGLATQNVPEGVSEDWNDKVQALVNESFDGAQSLLAWVQNDAEDKGDEPEATALVRNSVKLSLGKSAKAGKAASGGGASYSGDRRDTLKHIVNAFEGKESGTFLKIAEIVNTPSDEYGTDKPSPGAISARLFPKDKDGNPKESKAVALGIQPDTDEKGDKGARKL